MGIGAAIASGVAAITGAIGGAVATGAALVVGAETAATIGAIAGPALFGAGVGAVGSAITGGNPLIGALTGGLTGGLAGAGAGGAIGGALGIGEGAGNALVGAGVGALGSGLSGQNPLMGALTGAAGGFLSGGGLNDLGFTGSGGALGDAASSFGGGAGDAFTPGGSSVGAEGGQWDTGGTSVGSGALNQAANIAAPNATPKLDMADNSALNPQSQFTGASTSQAVNPGAKTAQALMDNAKANAPNTSDAWTQDAYTPAGSGAGVEGGQWDTTYGNAQGSGSSGVGDAAKGVLNWLGRNPNIALGALSGLSSLFSKPTQPTYANVPTAANNTAWNSQPLNFAPLNPNFGGRQATTPNVNYYTYGQIPGGARFFNNNSLRAYGFAKGGALNAAANDDEFTTATHDRHVQGPGTETSDSVPALLSRNEYVLDANDVRAIGHGSNERGARILDRERKKLTRNGGGALSMLARR